MTVPNLITTLRIILVPIFVIALLGNDFTSALFVFVLAGVSDAVDGLIARVFDQKSTLGAYLDPLADKILLVTAFIVLSVMGYFPAWLTVLVISRDVMILLGVLFLLLSPVDVNIKPTILSKLTTFLQLVSVFVVLAKNYLPTLFDFSIYFFWATGFFTTLSGLLYTRQWFKTMGKESPSQ